MLEQHHSVSRKAALFDSLFVIGCCGVYVAASFLDVRIGYIIPAVITALTGFVLFTFKYRPDRWNDFGFRLTNLWPSIKVVGPITLVGATALLIWATIQRVSIFRWEFIVLLPLYPIWGLIQQFIFQGILHRRLLIIFDNQVIALLSTTVIFSMIHIADIRIAGLTLLVGAIWSWSFQRIPNLWTLAVSHGILAALTYPLFLGENPLLRFF